MTKFKSFLLFTICFFTLVDASAQAPEKFKYQAVVRDLNGETINNQSVGLRISLLEGSSTGSIVYAETHNVTTSALGLVSLNIGDGAVEQGNFSSVNWGGNSFYIQVEVDEDGGTDYSVVGVSQLLSVPYALYSNLSGVPGLPGPTGATGMRGIQGLTGPTGPQGIQGITGPIGPTGVQGIQGIQGIQGMTGSQGIQGIQGVTGPTGPQGLQGLQGIQGIQGLQGPTGSQGNPGIQGPAGPQGLQGIQGIQGLQGPTGSQGNPGIQGPTGSRGLQGLKGVTGPTGGMPQVAFDAVSTTNQTFSNTASGNILFPAQLLNDGGAFNTATGEFTAPSNGVYHFDVTLFLTYSSAGARASVYFMVNGSVSGIVLYNTNYGNGEPVLRLYGSLNVELDAGDIVTVFGLNNFPPTALGNMIVSPYSSFRGHAVYFK